MILIICKLIWGIAFVNMMFNGIHTVSYFRSHDSKQYLALAKESFFIIVCCSYFGIGYFWSDLEYVIFVAVATVLVSILLVLENKGTRNCDTDSQQYPENEIRSELYGTVLEIKAAAGDIVHKGDELIILDRVKLETSLTAPKDGILSEILVKKGDSVQPGDLLAKFR